MARQHSWQRGAADLVSVGVGLTLLAVVFAGTTASFLYGREAMTREEYFKAAAYILRGKMEEVQTAIALVDDATNPRSARNLFCSEWVNYPPYTIEDRDDRHKHIVVTVSRKVRGEDLPETGEGWDYFSIEMRAQWQMRDFVEDRQDESGKAETLIFKTAFVARRGL